MRKLKKSENPFLLGYFLHAYAPPSIIDKIILEYNKAGVNAILVPSNGKSWPSIWGVKRRAWNRKIKKIWDTIEDDFNLVVRKNLGDEKL